MIDAAESNVDDETQKSKEGKSEEDLAEFNLENYDDEDDNGTSHAKLSNSEAIIPDPEDFIHEDNELIDDDQVWRIFISLTKG